MNIRPLRNLVYVERVHKEKTEGGILIPKTFRAGKSGHSASAKMDAVPDYFEAKVLHIGPEVTEIAPGDHLLVWSFDGGDGSKLYTGENVGEKDRAFIRFPDDVVCAIDLEKHDLEVAQ